MNVSTLTQYKIKTFRTVVNLFKLKKFIVICQKLWLRYTKFCVFYSFVEIETPGKCEILKFS